ncbi:MAG: VCBS repeat-containing protein [Deltaproteobacteria bacterium]|nr:VCBS repeat-containing protein [Deltaproteobacteria bacterium]
MTRARGQGVLALVALVALASETADAGDAPATTESPWLVGVYERDLAAIDAAIAARVPPLRPPVPVTVTWKPQRLASIDLGAPLVELAAADLDGDGRAELIALTTKDVVVLGARGKREIAVLGRAPVPRGAAAIGPRAPVGVIAIVRTASGAEVVARVSTAGRGARYHWSGTALTEVGAVAGFPLCTGAAELAAGRDSFGDGPTRRYAVRCTDELVDGDGRAMIAEGVLGPNGGLDVALRTRCAAGDAGCPPARTIGARGIGVAFAIADVDRDGRPEVIAAADGAPGDPDQVTVYPIPETGGTVGKPLFRRKFTGGVAAIAAADLDGDGTVEVVAAVRLVGAARIDLWFLA